MKKNEVLAWIRRSRLVPVIRASSSEEAMAAVAALIEGGIDIFEITMTVPGAIEVIRNVCEIYGERALVGAGTVLDAETTASCIDAGAQFIVSPCLDRPTVDLCNARGIAVAPGALTPTEVLAAWKSGADIVKIFPCEAVGGASYIKALKAPYPHIALMPTGGVSVENVATFFAAGADAVGIGSNLVDLKLLRDGRRSDLVKRAQEFRIAQARYAD
jgi:2-dehydro-3-deoxyphosphogluconate aldolase/(4S)-4-hydroxy-2-oxoglutarate aldolase